jgi:hypothetical protein
VKGFGCKVLSHPFDSYSSQRNWAIGEMSSTYDWQLHLDADEVLDSLAIEEIKRALEDPGVYAGFLVKRVTYFMSRRLRFGGTSSWHLRVFRSGSVKCEDRLYDQHFLCNGPVRAVEGLLHDRNASSIGEWVAKHNRWSTAEAEELFNAARQRSDSLAARLSGDPRERRRLYKQLYYKGPLLGRAIAYFLYRYFVQLGFLDGRAGFLYAFFQALWFRMLVDAKLMEKLSSVEEAGRT